MGFYGKHLHIVKVLHGILRPSFQGDLVRGPQQLAILRSDIPNIAKVSSISSRLQDDMNHETTTTFALISFARKYNYTHQTIIQTLAHIGNDLGTEQGQPQEEPPIYGNSHLGLHILDPQELLGPGTLCFVAACRWTPGHVAPSEAQLARRGIAEGWLTLGVLVGSCF